MTVEEFYVKYLSEKLNVPVSGDIPTDPKPARFVTLEMTGSSSVNQLYHPVIAVQSWAESRMEAARLNELVKMAMILSVSTPQISHCSLETDYNFPELELKHPRYQAVFDITYIN